MPAVTDGYVALLRLRGAAVLLSYASAARLIYGVLPIALLLFLSERRSSYGQAGAVVGLYGLAAGLIGPARSRLVDRLGAMRGLVVLTTAFALCLLALVVGVRSPLVVVMGIGLLAGGFPPPVGPVMRAAWRRMVGNEEAAVRRAYSLDAVTEEATFVLGPVLATTLVAVLGARVVLLACVVVLGVAVPSMALRVASLVGVFATATPTAGPDERGKAPWRHPPFLLGLVPVTSLGLMLGAVEIAAIAAALATVGERFAGIPAAALAFGSLIGGLLYGRRKWPGSASAHTVALTLSAAGLIAISAVTTDTFELLVALLGLAGLMIAPAFVASYLVADLAAPVGSSEATAWVNAAFNAALAIGTAGAGVVIDATSPSTALGAFAVAAALLIAAAGTRLTATREAARLP